MSNWLEEIQERLNNVTPGLWNVSACYQNIGDAQFIAAARTDIEWLLDEVKRLKTENDYLTSSMLFKKMKQENERLGQVLKIYANKDNWIEDRGEKCSTVFAFDCPFTVDNCTEIDQEPWLLAHKALAGDNE